MSSDALRPAADDDVAVLSTTSSPMTQLAALVFASLLMVLVGNAKKRLVVKSARCPVCHRDRRRCTCRWL